LKLRDLMLEDDIHFFNEVVIKKQFVNGNFVSENILHDNFLLPATSPDLRFKQSFYFKNCTLKI